MEVDVAIVTKGLQAYLFKLRALRPHAYVNKALKLRMTHLHVGKVINIYELCAPTPSLSHCVDCWSL